MAQVTRSPNVATANKGVGPGPYLAKIISHLDPTFSGDIQVSLLRNQANAVADDSQTFTVKCASPFFGYTPSEFTGANNKDFNDTQKAYGMWMVPPDVGVTVLVIFVDGDASQGYWIGCVPTRYGNQMVPAIGGTDQVDLTDADKKKYNTKQPLPVGEMNKRANTEKNPNPEKVKKPVHPIADRFVEQGTLEDDVRGTTTTTARREVPSMVFGISSPGPFDRRQGAKKGQIGKLQSKAAVPTSRLGGTQIVMDDGDERYQRKTPAGLGPVKYAEVLKGEKGQPDIPYNEYFRVRTRTGHQILMHNSEDLIYIANARGTAWIELTSNGKIDIFANDSISIHSNADFNFRAERDINLECGRNFNVNSGGNFRVEASASFLALVGSDMKLTVGSDYQILVGGKSAISTAGDMSINSSGSNKFSCAGSTNIASLGNHVESAAQIHMNGIAAAVADIATKVTPLTRRTNPATDAANKTWADAKYLSNPIESIMRRIPMHEPWILHENNAPDLLGPDQTDRDK